MDVKTLGPGGLADSAGLAGFCPPAEQCTITTVFDQSPLGNHIASGSGNFDIILDHR